MSDPVDALLDLLELANTGAGRFGSRAAATDRLRVYGGQLVAQALIAAGRSFDPDRALNAVHASFLKAGDPREAIDYSVEPIRDGAAVSSCRVSATQGSRPLLVLTASFHVGESGPELLPPAPMVPPPDDMVEIDDWRLAGSEPSDPTVAPYFVDAVEFRQHPSTFRPAPPNGHGEVHDRVREIWLRARSRLPDDQLLHQAAVAYASDKPMLGTTVLGPPLHGDPTAHLVASLDHAMWFHRPLRADEWLLLRVETATAGHARAFTRGEVFRADGALAVSVAQEGLIRPWATPG